jgi:hypothetical protein
MLLSHPTGESLIKINHVVGLKQNAWLDSIKQ